MVAVFRDCLFGVLLPAGFRIALALCRRLDRPEQRRCPALAPIRAPDERSAPAWRIRASSSISCSRSGQASWARFFAARLGQSVILGYILAGIAIGPYTPGFVAAELTVTALADIGIILLMFAIGVGLELSRICSAPARS